MTTPMVNSVGADFDIPKGASAYANPGYKFLRWQSVDGSQVSTDPLAFIPTKKHGELWGDELHAVYYAVFAPITYTIILQHQRRHRRHGRDQRQFGETKKLPANNGQIAPHGLRLHRLEHPRRRFGHDDRRRGRGP